MDNKELLDYEGLKQYHQRVMKEVKPLRVFDSKEDLVDKSNWEVEGTYIYGLSVGLMITIGSQVYQLINPEKFRSNVMRVGETITDKAERSFTELGWKPVGSTVDFEMDEHILKLTKEV